MFGPDKNEQERRGRAFFRVGFENQRQEPENLLQKGSGLLAIYQPVVHRHKGGILLLEQSVWIIEGPVNFGADAQNKEVAGRGERKVEELV